MSNLHEAHRAVHVQLKPSKERSQRHPEKAGDGWVKGQGPNIKSTTNYTYLSYTQSAPFSLSLSLSLSLFLSLPLSLSLAPSRSPSITHSTSLPL